MRNLESLCIPRQYTSLSFIGSARREVHLFIDASGETIAVVAFIKLTDADGNQRQGFLLGKAKVALGKIWSQSVVAAVWKLQVLKGRRSCLKLKVIHDL